MYKLIDSGSGAYNTMAYLVELDKSLKNKVEVDLLPQHIGNSNKDVIKALFTDKIKNGADNKNSFMACNTLNSIYGAYEGAFNEMLKYLSKNKKFKSLIICTKHTQHILNRYYKEKDLNFETMELDISIVKDIDKGLIPNIDLNTSLFDKLILGCTHYDLLNINTNLEVISTSKLSANRLYNILK
jgi:hypothetical protein